MTMTAPLLKAHRRDAAEGPARALIVFVHGYGADGADLHGLAAPLAGPFPRAAFLSPDAPDPCAINPMGRQWFPIPRMDGSPQSLAEAGLDRAASALEAFLDAERDAAGLSDADLALVGFSQGAMLSLHVALRRARPIGAVVALSGRLLRPETLAAEITARPPILLSHGDADEVVDPASLHEARAALGAVDAPLRWRMEPGLGHGIDEPTLRATAEHLAEHLPQARASD